MTEHLSGGDMLIRALQDEGVDYIFGYPGGAALHIYDAIFRQQRVEHILVRHEQAATHMADGYARATGRPGVVLVTSGPGATNAITGIATAYMDSIPMVVISGQVPTDLIGTDAFQETDMVGVSRPVVKHSFLVRSAADIPMVVKKAFYIATSGRPGPVVIDVPKDTTDPSITAPYKYPKSVSLRSYNPALRGHTGQIRRAVEALARAKRPGHLCRRRRGARQRRRVAHAHRAAFELPGNHHVDGVGRVPRIRSAKPRHARHARNLRSEQRDAFVRSDPRDRRALRRSRHQQSEEVLPAGHHRAHRRRPGVDLEDHSRRHPDRWSGAGGARRNGADARAGIDEARPARWRGIARVVEADRRVACHARLEPPHARARRSRREDPAAAGSAGVAQGNQWRCVRDERRRPAPDVRGAVLRVRRAAPVDQLRWARHDGFRLAGSDGRAVRAFRTQRSRA